MDQVRFGVIGVGNMGTNHVHYLYKGEIEGATLGAACDLKQSRRDWVTEFTGGTVPVFEDYHDMFASGLIDAVILAIPHYYHPIIGIEAFKAGLHVMSEKPIGVYTKKVKEFIAAAKESGKTFGIMFNQRTDDFYIKMHDMVKNGDLGELKRSVWIITDWYRTQAYYDSGSWRATWAGEGGGVLLNQAPHNIDLWQWIVGMPSRVHAFCDFGKYHDIEVEDDVTCYAQYPNGATGVFITTTGEFPGTNRFEISGTKGKLVYEKGKLLFTKLSVDEREFCRGDSKGFASIPCETVEIECSGHGQQHRGVLRNFVNHILHGEPMIAPGEDGMNMLSLANAMMLSSWKNDWVDLPNDGEEFYEELKKRIATSTVKKEGVEAVADLAGTFEAK